ncbi:MAG: poly(beta-D-mannuronate) lyase [Bacteroidetes bacterium]|nr:poly(beta-D-mannuronate) lyase [Bacteroidota bacterium]
MYPTFFFEMKKIIFILVFFCCISVYAEKKFVVTASAINNGSWIAGDTIVLKNGTWTNQTIALKANGTATNPIVLMAETQGKVILTGNSRLSFSGSYLIVTGLFFKDGTLSGSDVISFRTSASETATYCTLKNTAIINYNPADNTVDSKWVSLYGNSNTVEHCSFENKTNSGTLMVVWLNNGLSANHSISNNYFGYRNPNVDANGNELNGQEIIRIGDSSTSMTTANVTVNGNYFEKCNGEIEVVSNKSCGNTYINNLFQECKGMLTLRHGNSCIVEGNYFFGNGVSETGGVRIIGENHTVYNNYFENLRGSGYRAALCIVRGKENSALSEYYQVKNALVAFNTFVNCSQAFNINYNSSSSLTLPPINTTIAHNHIFNSSSSYNNVTVDQTNISKMSVTWKNNLMNQGRYTDFSYTASQVVTGKDAKMTQVATSTPIYEPGSTSALKNYSTTEYANITTDIRGRLRTAASKTPGASQLSGTVSISMPVKEETGASFTNSITTDTSPLTSNKNWSYTLTANGVEISFQTAGSINLYNLNGSNILAQKAYENSTLSINLPKGLYLLQFINNQGYKSIEKILIKK